MNPNPQRGIVPTARQQKPAQQTASAAAPGSKAAPPAGFDPKKFLMAASTIPTTWSRLSMHDKLTAVMAYLPNVKDSNVIAAAIEATDKYAYQITSPTAPMLHGPPVGKAAPTVVSPQMPQSTVGVDPRRGFVDDVPQEPIPPRAPMTPKPLVVFDAKSGKMVVPGRRAPARQASSPPNWFGWLSLFGLVVSGIWLWNILDTPVRERRRRDRHDDIQRRLNERARRWVDDD